MAIKKFVAISYCFAFLSVYLCSMAYALISTSINKSYNVNLPQTTAMNASATFFSSSLSWSRSSIINGGIIILIIAIITIIISNRFMSSAM